MTADLNIDELERLAKEFIADSAKHKRHHSQDNDAHDAYVIAANPSAILSLIRRVREAEEGARRYRLIANMQPNQLYIERNSDHACNYMSAKEYIEEIVPSEFENVDHEELQKMKDTNTIWSIQVYPDTPIGFYRFNGASLDSVVDKLDELIQEQTK